ncbi:glycosyltransferase [Vibrio lamellibrachiae]|uniref:glycosyltransferase family 2 protein n=1 Tax=Vibrio lamellibrachiae TaxID=2910253 RepID=UPI003D0BC518
MKINVIIPVKNEEHGVQRCIDSFVNNNTLDLHFIVVDDNSEDGTYESTLNYFKDNNIPGVVLRNNTQNPGAGACRNIGIKHIQNSAKYIMFFDADDTTNKGSLSKMLSVAEKDKADFVVAKYNYCRSEDVSESKGMLNQDKDKWRWSLGNADYVTIRPVDKPYLIECVNYPWNKLYRAAFVKQSKLTFSETLVNNDIYAHWHSYANASKVSLVDTKICNHFVIPGNSQITSTFDKTRFSAFTALEELEQMLRNDEKVYRVYFHLYLKFKLGLFKWIHEQLPVPLRKEFRQLMKISYQSLSSSDVLKVSLMMPNVASDAAEFKMGVKSL